MTAPDRLTRLSVKSFRRLADVDVPLGPLNVLVGPNGAGKTSFLDVLDMLSASAQGRLSDWLVERGGLHQAITRGVSTPALVLAIEVSQGAAAPCTYELQLRAEGARHVVTSERLTQPDKAGHVGVHLEVAGGRESNGIAHRGIVPRVRGMETALSGTSSGEACTIKAVIASATRYYCTQLDTQAGKALRLPQQVRPDWLPSQTGDNLVSCLYGVRESNASQFALLCDTLASAYGDFEDLTFPAVANGVLALAWKQRGYSHPFNAHELSDGMLRFLWLVTILYSPELPALLMLDEPETSLHPDLLRLLVDLLREASQRSQIIVATQSESLVRFLRPEEVLILDVQEEGVTLRRADELGLDTWLQEYSLEELWRQNRLGGRA